jgi:uncharacterized protein (DUF1778 family)
MSPRKLKIEGIKIRLTTDEKNMLANLADQAGMSMSDYVRTLIFRSKRK